MNEMNYKVAVECITYNHAAYIEDTLNGFCSQETNFPFVCVIIDDHSTDDEQHVIENYLNKNFEIENNLITERRETDDYSLIFSRHKYNVNCYFAALFLKYNHYQIEKSKVEYYQEWFGNSRYIAFCEGDDYWIDPKKLQKQVDILEKDEKCTMAISNGYGLHMSNNTKTLTNPIQGAESRYVSTSEILIEKNGIIPTASICCRSKLYERPDVFKVKHIGDKPLKMWCAINGNVYYDATPMVVHRVGAPGSFGLKVSCDKRYAVELSENMTAFYNRFNDFTKRKYNEEIKYLVEFTEYKLYLRTGDYISLARCEFQKRKPFLRRIRTVIGLYLQCEWPRLYSIIKK